jgi:hypothetical protein
MNLVILGVQSTQLAAVLAGTAGVFLCAVSLWLASRLLRSRALVRFHRQVVLLSSEFTAPLRVNTARCVNSLSRAPPEVALKRRNWTTGDCRQ